MLCKEPYEDVKHLINEGDVLLFRGKGFFTKFVQAYGQSSYSHCGIASWVNGSSNTKDGILEIVEFREGSPLAGLFGGNGGGGGRSVSLETTVKKYSGQIDVYRPVQNFGHWFYNQSEKTFEYKTILFDGRAVTRILRRMTGLPYGWRRVWWMLKYRLFYMGLYSNYDWLMDDEVKDIVYPVCSVFLSYGFNINNFDLVKNKSDEWTSPGDIASSPRLSYLFTLC